MDEGFPQFANMFFSKTAPVIAGAFFSRRASPKLPRASAILVGRADALVVFDLGSECGRGRVGGGFALHAGATADEGSSRAQGGIERRRPALVSV